MDKGRAREEKGVGKVESYWLCNRSQGEEEEEEEEEVSSIEWEMIEMSEEEEDMIKRMHKLVGDKWGLIAGRIPGRSAQEIERYWLITEPLNFHHHTKGHHFHFHHTLPPPLKPPPAAAAAATDPDHQTETNTKMVLEAGGWSSVLN